jgi:hypothetical protein
MTSLVILAVMNVCLLGPHRSAYIYDVQVFPS